MKKIYTYLSKRAATVLPFIAILFATSACMGKLYEPKLPEQLK